MDSSSRNYFLLLWSVEVTKQKCRCFITLPGSNESLVLSIEGTLAILGEKTCILKTVLSLSSHEISNLKLPWSSQMKVEIWQRTQLRDSRSQKVVESSSGERISLSKSQNPTLGVADINAN